VEGHFEQFCNAHDAEKAGAGIRDSAFNIARFADYVKSSRPDPSAFRKWADSSGAAFLDEIDTLLSMKAEAVYTPSNLSSGPLIPDFHSGADMAGTV
jgi:hypothetical protein